MLKPFSLEITISHHFFVILEISIQLCITHFCYRDKFYGITTFVKHVKNYEPPLLSQNL